MCEQTIQIMGMLGTWFAGLGTFAAASIALWIALRAKKVDLKCNVGLRVIVGGGKSIDCLSFQVANVGERSVTVDSVGWRIGRGKNRRYAIQFLGTMSPAQYPKRLSPGERASFLVDFLEPSEWMQTLHRDFIKGEAVDTLRAQIDTSVGHIKYIKPEKTFLTALQDVERGSKSVV